MKVEDGSATELIRRWQAGDAEALSALLPQIYAELKQLARASLRREMATIVTIQPTALVHEAYLRLLGGVSIPLNDRHHLLAMVARLMRQVLVDRARARQAEKRDGGQRVTLSELVQADAALDADMLALDGALRQLESIDPRKAQVVELRVFGGLDFAEIGTVTGRSRATLDRDFRTARAWLYRQLAEDGMETA